jgi:hypothetical protein
LLLACNEDLTVVLFVAGSVTKTENYPVQRITAQTIMEEKEKTKKKKGAEEIKH